MGGNLRKEKSATVKTWGRAFLVEERGNTKAMRWEHMTGGERSHYTYSKMSTGDVSDDVKEAGLKWCLGLL